MNQHLLFVYGTLLPPLAFSSALQQSKALGPARLFNAKLLMAGEYPGILPGRTPVFGMLYEVDEETLARVDDIKDDNPQHQESSLYLRRLVEVEQLADGQSFDAWTYFLHEDHLPTPTTLVDIEHGDYRRYLQEQEQPHTQWMIAYGSNLSTPRMAARIGQPLAHKRGTLQDAVLVMNKRSIKSPISVANVRFQLGAQCPAVAWKVTHEALLQMDPYEGSPYHYARIIWPFCDEQGLTYLAHTYVSLPQWLDNTLSPTPTYIQHIRNGYKEHGFDMTYLEAILSHNPT